MVGVQSLSSFGLPFDGFDLDRAPSILKVVHRLLSKTSKNCHCLPSVNCWYASPGESSPSLVLVP